MEFLRPENLKVPTMFLNAKLLTINSCAKTNKKKKELSLQLRV